MTLDNLTPGEIIFLRRMLPHFMAGKTVEQAAQAVLADDQRLFLALVENRTLKSYGAPGDGSAYLVTAEATETATTLKRELSRIVYERLRP